jgi:exodeoxyribonuclease VII large subunit
VISAVGHDVDRTLIDDVAAVCCSTPTHAAEAAVRTDCGVARERLARVATRVEAAGGLCIPARERLARMAVRVDAAGRRAVVERARALVAQSRAPRDHLERHRARLHQLGREMRAATHRGRALRLDFMRRIAASVIGRRRDATLVAVGAGRERLSARAGSIDAAGARVDERAKRLAAAVAALDRAGRALEERRSEALAARTAALRAHDPERALERGYALLMDPDGEPLPSADALRRAGRFEVRLADGSVGAQVIDSDDGGTT